MSSKSQVKSEITQAYLKEVGRIADEALERVVDFVALKNKLGQMFFSQSVSLRH